MADLILTAELAAEIELALGQAAANRIASANAAGSPSLGVEVRRFGPIAATLVRRACWYYGYFGGLSGLAADDWAAFDEALAWLRAAGASARVSVSPYTPPAGARERFLDALAERRFQPTGFMSVLFAPAGHFDTADMPSGLTIRPAEGPDLEAFLDIWLVPLDEPERSAFRPLPRHEFADWRSYVAFVDGEPAGVGSLLAAGRIGVLAAAVTLPHLRCRGVQTALLRRRIAEAARAGRELVVSQASPGTISERNMQRVGLRPAFTQVIFSERSASFPISAPVPAQILSPDPAPGLAPNPTSGRAPDGGGDGA